MEPLWAHSRNVNGVRHLLADHLRGTAALARRFGAGFGAGEFSYGSGLLHDVGKLANGWQPYLLAREAGLRPSRVDHKTPGAALMSRLAAKAGWLICQGHHTGIPDCGVVSPEDATVDSELLHRAHELLPELADLLAGPSLIPPSWRTWFADDPLAAEMAIRLVHSTLVDADFIDTAAHFNATEPQVRPDADFALINEHFTERLSRQLAGRRASPIDDLRAALLDECLDVAQRPCGVYRLAAPTGSGKTIAAGAFALAHAARNGMRRVVIAVPFVSITEQNAAVYRQLVGDEHVIEHHSAVAPDSKGPAAFTRAKYGVENWDAPFVVTTTVQLFESMFSNRPSKTRKLHRLTNSVIVLDEIQATPRHVLPTILDGLRTLHERFGATIVLSSATQPTWHLLGPWREAAELEVRDIVAQPAQLYAGLRRSTVEWLELASLAEVADAVAAERQTMIVVNTIANARDLARLVLDREPEDTLHLSTRMYPAHRRRVLATVRSRLEAGLTVRLVTTQLVEAGVDLDFPVVFRAMAPAENLSQARGRCNREGRLASGRFVVIGCPDLWELEKEYGTGIAKTRQHFRNATEDLDDPELMTRYFADVYRTLGVEEQAGPKSLQADRAGLQYERVAKRFRMIDDDTMAVVIGAATEASAILDELVDQMTSHGAPSPDRFRRLQDFSVNLPKGRLTDASLSIIEEIPGVAVWRGPYDDFTGVTIDSNTPQDSVW